MTERVNQLENPIKSTYLTFNYICGCIRDFLYVQLGGIKKFPRG